MLDKTQILLPEFIVKKNYEHVNRLVGYYAVEAYYYALYDLEFITNEEFNSVMLVNERVRRERRFEDMDD